MHVRRLRLVSRPDSSGQPGFISALKSAVAAAFGVQSGANRARDFNSGRPIHFIAAGLLITLIFIATVMLAVQLVLALV